MRKFSLTNLLLISVLFLSTTESFAQNNPDQKDNSASANANAVNNPSPNQNPDVQNPNNDPNLTNKKFDLLGKPLDNSALVENIQGGMANLLLGNKSTSLMFDDRETDNIERALDSFKNNQAYTPDEGGEESILDGAEAKKKREQEAAEKARKEQDEFNAKSYIYLASIMYSTPQDWVVWVNDKKITSETNKKGKELFLKSVDRDHVSILWNVSPSKLKVLLGAKADSLKLKVNDSGQIEVKFSLQPNQTFVLGSNTVVEGKIVTNQIKKRSDDFSAPDPNVSNNIAPVDTPVSKYKTRINQN